MITNLTTTPSVDPEEAPEVDEDYDDTAADEQGNLPGDSDW